MEKKDNPLEIDSKLNSQEVPLLSDIVPSYVELSEKDIAEYTPSIDSELAAIEEDDLALQSVAEDEVALTEMAFEDSYDYSDGDGDDGDGDGDESELGSGPFKLSVPQPDIVINAIRSELHKKLSKEMNELISPVLEQTIAQVTEVIRSEVSQTLEARISTLIQQELDKQFGKK
jgi:hypothetical protein